MNAFLWALLTACIWGVVPLLEKTGLTKVDPFTGLFFRCAGVIMGFVLLGTYLAGTSRLKAITPRAIMLLVLAGFLASFVAQITFYHALKCGEVSKVVPVSGMYYLVTFVLGILLFKEPLSLQKGAGIFLVISGMWLLR